MVSDDTLDIMRCSPHIDAWSSPIQYAPYAFIPLLAPVIALAGAYTGRLVIWADEKQSGLFSRKLKQKKPALSPDYSLEISLKALKENTTRERVKK